MKLFALFGAVVFALNFIDWGVQFARGYSGREYVAVVPLFYEIGAALRGNGGQP